MSFRQLMPENHPHFTQVFTDHANSLTTDTHDSQKVTISRSEIWNSGFDLKIPSLLTFDLLNLEKKSQFLFS